MREGRGDKEEREVVREYDLHIICTCTKVEFFGGG